MSSYTYDKTDTATNDVNERKIHEEVAASSIATELLHVNGFETYFELVFASSLSTQEESDLDALVATHQHITTAESLAVYLDNIVFPFIKNLINTFAAENIALGITQAGKTADVLGLFEKAYDIGAAHDVSLKGSFDTGSLYVSIAIIQHVRDNPSEFTGLSPFVTDARLLGMKNKIEEFLGVPLST